MKIILSILSAFLYLMLSLNITFNVHYCNNEFESLSILESSNTFCCPEMEVKFCASQESCCEIIRLSFLFDADEKVAIPLSTSVKDFQSVKIKEVIKTSPALNQNRKIKHLFCDLPPPIYKDIYKENCSLVFYG